MNAPVKTPAVSFEEAFLKAQAAIRPAIKDSTNPAFRSKYADLGAVWEAVKTALHENGLSVIQSPQFDGDTMWLDTTIMHVSGGRVTGRYPLRPSKPDPQGYGSALTYARRYSLSSMLGVIADDDDDGNAASAPKPAQQAVPYNNVQDQDVSDGVANFVRDMKNAIDICKTVSAVTDWEDTNAPMLDRLKRKALPAWSELMKYRENKIGNLNLAPKEKA